MTPMRQRIWKQVEGNKVSRTSFGDTHPKMSKNGQLSPRKKMTQLSPRPIGKKTAAIVAACFCPSFLQSRRRGSATLRDTRDTLPATHEELPQTRASIGFPLIPYFAAISSQSRLQESITQNGGKSITGDHCFKCRGCRGLASMAGLAFFCMPFA